jgi:hypothetical protein
LSTTIFEVADRLPNGLHDAEVDTIRIDYPHRTMELTLDVWIGRMDGPPSSREMYRRGVLKITGLGYCAMDLPDERYPFANPKPLRIDLAAATAFRPDGFSFACRLWVNEWNGFIHLSGQSAELVWQAEPINRGA